MSERGMDQLICDVCPHHCRISEGRAGKCRARGVRDGKVVSLNYGISPGQQDPVVWKLRLQFELSFLPELGDLHV